MTNDERRRFFFGRSSFVATSERMNLQTSLDRPTVAEMDRNSYWFTVQIVALALR